MKKLSNFLIDLRLKNIEQTSQNTLLPAHTNKSRSVGIGGETNRRKYTSYLFCSFCLFVSFCFVFWVLLCLFWLVFWLYFVSVLFVGVLRCVCVWVFFPQIYKIKESKRTLSKHVTWQYKICKTQPCYPT